MLEPDDEKPITLNDAVKWLGESWTYRKLWFRIDKTFSDPPPSGKFSAVKSSGEWLTCRRWLREGLLGGGAFGSPTNKPLPKVTKKPRSKRTWTHPSDKVLYNRLSD